MSGTLVVPAGQTQASFTVPVLDDAIYENAQTFPIRISAVSGGEGAFFESPAPKVTIANDDVARIYVDDLTVDESSGTAAVKIRCPDAREPSVSIIAMTQNGTGIAGATAPTDFIQRSATLVMAPDQNEIFFDITIVDDYVPERQESFLVGVGGSGLTIADASATVTIVDGGPGYDGWAQQQGYNPNQHSRFVATGDFDKDGNQNLVSFAMGLPIGQPVSAVAASWLPAAHPPALTGDRLMLETSVPDPLPAGIRWEIQESTDAQSWTSVATATPSIPWSGDAGIPVTVGDPVAGRRPVIVGSSFTRAESPTGLMRLKWTLLPP